VWNESGLWLPNAELFIPAAMRFSIKILGCSSERQQPSQDHVSRGTKLSANLVKLVVVPNKPLAVPSHQRMSKQILFWNEGRSSYSVAEHLNPLFFWGAF
jgi:hypothetical protein